MNNIINVDYTELEKQVKEAQKSEYIQKLSGMSREIVLYIYSEILDNIQNGLFPKNITKLALRRRLFELKFNYSGILINTSRRSSSRIKFYRAERKEYDTIIRSIDGAMKIVGLETSIRAIDSCEKKMEVFVTVKNGEP